MVKARFCNKPGRKSITNLHLLITQVRTLAYKITVGYNAAAEGPFTKFITITYNGKESKQVTIKGEVWKTPTESAPANAAASEIKN